MLASIISLIFGFALLALGAEQLISGVQKTSNQLRVSLFFVSMTLVALGTSLAELFVCLAGLRNDLPETVVGNIIGSNTINLGLALGLGALIHPVKLTKRDLSGSKVLAVVTIGFSLLMLIFEQIGQLAGGVMLCLLFLILGAQQKLHYLPQEELETLPTVAQSRWVVALQVLFGSGVLWIGSEIVIPAAIDLGQMSHMDYTTVSLVVLALGTSLPEVATCIIAALKKQPTIAVAGIIGSNIMNILLVGGVSSIIRPIPSPMDIWSHDLALMLGMTVTFTLFALTQHRLGRVWGILFVLCYLVNTAVKVSW